MGPHMGPKRLGNTNNVVACPMRVLHSTTQTEYQLLETPPVCLFVKRAFPANLMVLKFATLSNCAKPTIVNVVGYTHINIDQIKSRETEAGWSVYGPPRVHLRSTYGPPRVNLRSTYGPPRVHLRSTYGPPRVHLGST